MKLYGRKCISEFFGHHIINYDRTDLELKYISIRWITTTCSSSTDMIFVLLVISYDTSTDYNCMHLYRLRMG